MACSKRRSILFTQRSWHKTPNTSNAIGVLDLAAFCREMGHDVACYPIDRIPAEPFDMVGLSVFSSFEGQAVKDALHLKSRFPGAEIVVGGRWTRCIDAGEAAVLERNGITVWASAGEEYFAPGAETDLSRYPSWSSRDFRTMESRGTNIMSSRGCPYHCNFCHNTERTVSFFSPERTADNIELLIDSGIPEIFFVDDIFTMKNRHMLDIYHECARRGVDIRGRNRFFSHVNFITPETAEIMKMFNPIEVQIGIESGDNRMLSAMGKTFDADAAFEKIRLLSKYVPVNCLFLIGFPGESEESLRTTLKFIEAIKPFVTFKWVSYYQPVPQTRGYLMARRHGTIFTNRHDNADITYLDANLSSETLSRYHALMLGA